MKSIAHIESPEGLGAVIRKARKRENLTQTELAKKAEVSRSFIIELERGHTRAELGKVLNVLKSLDVPLAAVLPSGSGAVSSSAPTEDAAFRRLDDKSDIRDTVASPSDLRFEQSVAFQLRARNKRASNLAEITEGWRDGGTAPDSATEKVVNSYIEGTVTLKEAITKLKKLSIADQ